MRRNERNLEKRIVDLIQESLKVCAKYEEVRELYRAGRLTFSSIEDFVDDRGKSCLFRLKELSHELFRNEEAGYRERLFDMLIGYMFHEAMKLRENLYQIEFYKPKLENLLQFRKEIVDDIKELAQKTETRLREGIRQIGVLMRDFRVQLVDLFRHYGTSYLIPRLLLEHKRKIQKALGKKALDKLIKEMYGEERNALLVEAAKSYLRSDYYEEARTLLKRCISVDRKDSAALFLFRYASAFHFYLKGNPRRALSFAKQALSMGARNFREFRRELKMLMAEIVKDVGGRHANI